MALSVLAGCATFPGAGLSAESDKAAKEQAVAARSNAYWQAIIGGDYEAAYRHLSPSSRESVPLARFRGLLMSGGVVRRAAKVEKVECEVTVCKAVTSLTFDHALMKGIVTSNDETWIIESGQAWLLRKL